MYAANAVNMASMSSNQGQRARRGRAARAFDLAELGEFAIAMLDSTGERGRENVPKRLLPYPSASTLASPHRLRH